MKQSKVSEVKRNLVPLGIAAALLAAAFYAASSVMVRIVVRSEAHPFVMVAFTSALGAILLAPIAARGFREDRKARFRGFAWAALTGPLTLMAVGFFYSALQHSPVVVVTPLVAIYPLGSILLARLFLSRQESFSPSVILGALLVVGGAVMVSIAAAG